jgi:hypothetical protein
MCHSAIGKPAVMGAGPRSTLRQGSSIRGNRADSDETRQNAYDRL